MVSPTDIKSVVSGLDDVIPAAMRKVEEAHRAAKHGHKAVGKKPPTGHRVDAGADDPATLVRAAKNPSRRDAPADIASQDVAINHPGLSAADPFSLAPKPTGFDRMLGAADSAANAVGMVAFMGLPIINVVGKGIEKVGGWVNVKPVARAGAAIQVPAKFASEKTFADLGRVTHTSAAAGNVSKPLFGGFAWLAEKFSDLTGLGGRQRAKNLGRLHVEAERAAGLAKGLSLDSAHPSIARDLGQMQRTLLDAEHPSRVDVAALKKSVVAVETAMEKGVNGEAIKLSELKPLRKAMEKFVKSAGRVVGYHEAAEGWKHVGDTVRNAPKAIAGTNIAHGMMNGAFIASSGLSMFSDARGFKQNLVSLKQMYADMTGKDASKVSTLLLLMPFNKVPAQVADARKHLLVNVTLKEIADAINVGVNVKQAVDHRFSMLKAMSAFGASMAVGMGADMVMGPSPLPYYKALSDAHRKGQEIPAEALAEFIGVACKELKDRGGADSPFTQAVAQQYAQEKLSPAQIMQEIEDGKMMVRVQALIAADQSTGSAQHVDDSPVSVSHTDMLSGAKKDRPIVGKYTSQINSSALPTLGQTV